MEGFKVVEHAHPLKLIDLQLRIQYEKEEDEDDDEGGDPITKESFEGVTCERCGEEIHMYHRHYYKCMEDSSCHLSLHKFCAEIPQWFKYPFHPHPLLQQQWPWNWTCHVCKQRHKPLEMVHRCTRCDFWIDANCAVEVGKKIIHHPCHAQLLICTIPKPILCDCSACGRRHEGIFFQSTIWNSFTIHSECAFLPKTLLIQERTNGAFYHTHPLTISYSFPIEDQRAQHFPKCRVCGVGFYHTQDLWIYKCDKCMYYAHLDCATSRREPFMSILSAGKPVKNFEDADHPHLLHLPFPDETHSILEHLFFQENGVGRSTTHASDKVTLTHMSHHHPLILFDLIQSNGQTSSLERNNSWLLSKCHNPMKKTQLLCNGCLRPIMSTMPFYICVESCNNFALHEWCTRLPQEIENHPGHPQHTLLLKYSNALPHFFSVFNCAACGLPCNGFAYCCVICKYYVDVTCGFIPKEITHKAHPDHLLSIVPNKRYDQPCHICLKPFDYNRLPNFVSYIPSFENQPIFHCNMCNIYIHPECALLLPEKIGHKYDKHPMHLSYLPIENHKSEYFCEICEEDLDPHASFYHCHDCVHSIHPACAPLILQSETNTYLSSKRNIYCFVNIKFGGIHNSDGHPHPLSFAQGIVSDGNCSICSLRLLCKMIFKCLKCKFAIDYRCCEREL